MNNYLVLATLIGIAVLVVLFSVIFIYRNRGQKLEPDYRVFFILGITWLPLGIATDNPAFLGLGIVFMAIGLANRGRWKKAPKWSELSPERRRTKLLLLGGMTALILVALVVYIMAKSN
jgi:hypothetical protein